MHAWCTDDHTTLAPSPSQLFRCLCISLVNSTIQPISALYPLLLLLSLSLSLTLSLSLSLTFSVPPLQDICMPAMRAQASAIYVGVITIIASLGPVFVSVTTLWLYQHTCSCHQLWNIFTTKFTVLSQCHAGTSPARSHLSVWSMWEGSWLCPPCGGTNLLHPVGHSLCCTWGHYTLLGQERVCTGYLHCCQRWRLMSVCVCSALLT